MASEGASANPIILGPSTPTCSPKPPSLPTLSPKLSPSADSFGSSRPVSQHSSSTSISDPSSEVEWSQIHRSVPADETTELPPPFVNRSPQSPKSPSPNLDSRPRSEPSTDTQGSDPGSQAPLPARGRWHSGEAWYKWYQVAGVAITLAVTVVALRYGVRSDRMARREMYNGDLQACLAYVQANLTLSLRCKKLVYDKGVLEPIYNIGKRALRGALTTDSKLAARRLKSVGGFRTGECEVQEGSFLYAYVSGFAIAVTLVLGGLLLVCARGKAKREEVFTSPARFDYQITRHHKDGPQTVTWQAASFVRHKPDEDQYPRELRRSIQEGDSDTGAEYKNKWQRFNSSCDTLVNPQTGPNPSRVSIASQSADEKHEGLIELETTGDNKTFFDPDTGEFIHLTPWKSTYDEHSVNGGDKGSVKRAVAKMFPGGVAWAAGKEVGEAVRSKTTSVEQRGGDGMHRRVPPQAGDCITGEVTHEAPSGRPQIA